MVECGAEFIHGTETVLNGILESYNDAHSGEEIMVRDVFTGAQGDGGPIGVTKDGGCGVYYITCGDGVKRLVWWDEEEGGFEASNEACWEVEECEVSRWVTFVSEYRGTCCAKRPARKARAKRATNSAF